MHVRCCLLLLCLWFTTAPAQPRRLERLADSAIAQSLLCLQQSVQEVQDRNRYPGYANRNLQWKLNTSADWTSGFYPGTLWYAYQLSGDTLFRQWAMEWTAGIAQQKLNNKTHDLGFRFLCTFGNGIRLAAKYPGTENYRETLLTAAATADSRFAPVIGMYPSDWDKKPIPNTTPVVVDVIMNLELLLWAAQHGGDTAMRGRSIQHALQTWRYLVRPDGSTWHVARFDRQTGSLVNQGQLQGDTDSSTWSRGHAWMVYGYTVMYRYTRDPQFLQMAVQLANYFLSHLPEDKVAYWDFQSQEKIRDASASAIVASALLELQQYCTSAKLRKLYLQQAGAILYALCSPPYFSQGKGTNCLLLHSTQYYRQTDNTDVPASFADYYFLEALSRYKQLPEDIRKISAEKMR